MNNDFSSGYKQPLQTAIPLLAAFFITRQLRLHGWRSLLVYMLVANVVRQLLEWGEQVQFLSLPLLQSPENEIVAGNGKLVQQQTDQGSSPVGDHLPYRVVHAIPGRVRIKFSKISEDGHFASWLESLIARHPPITGVRINRGTGSIVVTYDTTQTTLTDLNAALSTLLTMQHSHPLLFESSTEF